ncbi:hypothetical protein CY35_04G085900 [Sphagnum magellanicum]|nr:hypothetical protein CY35_04G085900 [Sphagnum magellanicum]
MDSHLERRGCWELCWELYTCMVHTSFLQRKSSLKLFASAVMSSLLYQTSPQGFLDLQIPRHRNYVLSGLILYEPYIVISSQFCRSRDETLAVGMWIILRTRSMLAVSFVLMSFSQKMSATV